MYRGDTFLSIERWKYRVINIHDHVFRITDACFQDAALPKTFQALNPS